MEIQFDMSLKCQLITISKHLYNKKIDIICLIIEIIHYDCTVPGTHIMLSCVILYKTTSRLQTNIALDAVILYIVHFPHEPQHG